ncbi:DNA primase [Labilibaculum euxinus]|uniref:DNA primase n=1 Tax=Labilibaculum euxinus TaxID=2686357 RepID=A0A7M4D2F6_9BACT|nr:DNA primase [Labilibaculum euxinus]MUP36835.1 DNA primase [Labilibaculum euxinus]MVB06040.1 DNA primase [Labilibaculum euxinus]
MIDQSTVARIFDSAEITEVVSDFVTLKKRGVNFLGLCPFHNEKSPSFTVSPAKGIYKCFGCGKGGNSVNFIMEHEHLDYVGALKYLAKKYHIEVVEKELSPEQERQKNDRESMMIVNSFAQKSFTQNLYEHAQGMAIGMGYMRERGFRDDIIKKFQVGYCLEAWDAFSNHALDCGYKKEYLVKTGLSIEKENRLLDRFRGRVIFPIHGIAGRVQAFGGRILKNDAKAAKYLNSPESEVYHKSRILYGIFQAKKSIVQNEKCFLVEGYTDVLSFHQAGIENVVASSGTALTADQIRLIKRFTNNITIIYDGDAAGIKASLRGIDLVLEQEVNVKVLLLPQGEDPDSFSRTMGASELMEYIEKNESDFIVFKTNLLLKDAKDDPVKRANLIIDIVRSIAIIPDGIVRAVYVRECSNILNVDERVLYTEINKIIHRVKEDSWKNEQRSNLPEDQTTDKLSENSAFLRSANECDLEERALIRILLNFGSEILYSQKDEAGNEEQLLVGQYIITELSNDELESVNPLYQLVFDQYGENMEKEAFNTKTFFRDLPNEKVNQLAADILSEPHQLSGLWTRNESVVESEEMKLKEIVPKLVNEYKGKKVRLLMKEVMQEMQKAQDTGNADRMMELMKQKMVLDQIKNAISKELGNRTIS